MFELLSSGANLLIPKSGPGSKKLLKGSKRVGYFGTVPLTELKDDFGLLLELGVTGTKPSTYPTFFDKFIIDGKILFIPNAPFMLSTSYLTTYQRGLMYGVDSATHVPPPGQSRVEQGKLLRYRDSEGDTWGFNPRSMRFFDSSGAVGPTTLSEFSNYANRVGKAGNDRWALEPISKYDTAQGLVFSDRDKNNSSYLIVNRIIDYNAITSLAQNVSVSYVGYSYWPVFELYDISGMLFPAEDIRNLGSDVPTTKLTIELTANKSLTKPAKVIGETTGVQVTVTTGASNPNNLNFVKPAKLTGFTTGQLPTVDVAASGNV